MASNGVDPRSTRGSQSQGTRPLPSDLGHAIEIPASRPSMSDTNALMHHLSLNPSMKDRRGSRNSFGTSLPIPRSPRLSRLSSTVRPAAGARHILASQVQDMSQEKVEKVKNMGFAFDIDGVLVHGLNPIEEGKAVMKILNGDNELGESIS